jgi:DNA modification methylase
MKTVPHPPPLNDLGYSPNAQTQHMLIEGENLEVLRVLQKSYYGKVKMIYIDPPYNTGNDSFVYPDDYSETLDEYQKRTGEKNDEGYLNKQSLWKKNSKESGQYHSAWLSMMYPRLYLARNLLRDDGVIFISIDDNEAANLKLLCDEVFGAETKGMNPFTVWTEMGTATEILDFFAGSGTTDVQTAMLTELLLKNGLGAWGVHAMAQPRQVAGLTVHQVLYG